MVAVLAWGVFLRVFRFDTFEFKGDELEGIMRGLEAPAQHWWIDHGATASVHIPFGPAFSYIMGLLTAVSPDPYVLTALILAANIFVLMLAVLFFAEFSKDQKQFSLCVFLFSLSPYLIIFSRKIWQPNLLLLFVIPLVLMTARVHKAPRLFLPIGLLTSVIVQLHHSGIFYVPVLICFVVLSFRLAGRRTEDEERSRTAAGMCSPPLSATPSPAPPATRRFSFSVIRNSSSVPRANPDHNAPTGQVHAFWPAVGLIAFILPLVPYLSFLIHNFRQAGIVQWAARTPYHFGAQGAIKWALFSATGSHFWRYMFSGRSPDWSWPVAPLPGAVVVFCYLLVVPLLLGVFNYVKSALIFIRAGSFDPAARPDLRDLLCTLSIVFVFVIYCLVLDHGRPHHFTIILPFLILALSDGILSLRSLYATSTRPLFRRLGTPALILLLAGLISYAFQYTFVLLYVNANNGSTGEYGICFREQREAAKKIALLADRGQIGINPAVGLDNSFSSSRKAELQDTIAYICKTEFGTEVVFNPNAKPCAKTLKLLKTGEKLHIEISE